MKSRHLGLNLFARQYTEKSKFLDSNRAIKQLECHCTKSFMPCNTQNLQENIFENDAPVYTCKFSPLQNDYSILAVANENGFVCLDDTKRKNARTFVQTHNNTVFDLAWMPGERQFVTVSGDHSAKLWDCSESEVKMVSEFLGHTRSVKCVHFKLENTAVFATGSRDGSLILWDTRSSTKCSRLPATQHPDQTICPPHSQKKKQLNDASQSSSVTGVIFQDDNTLISSGSYDQYIRVWDMRKTYSRSISTPMPKYQLAAPSTGFSHLCVNSSGTKLYANCMDSYIYCFNINSYDPEPISAFFGHRNESFYVKSSLSNDGLYLMSGSSDKFGYVWYTKEAEMSEHAIKPLVILPGHTAEVACVSMSHEGTTKVVSCSDDGTYRLWYPYNLEKSTEPEATRDTATEIDFDKWETVRTRWRNKRKREPTGDGDSNCPKHTKICRLYNDNLPTVACVCTQSIFGVKRTINECEKETKEMLRLKKRCMDFETQERTPPKFNELNENKVTPENEVLSNRRTFVKATSKRKLADMPNFIDGESRNRKMHCGRILSPVKERAENGQDEEEVDGVGVINEYQDLLYGNILTEYRFEVNKKENESEALGPEFSSPTTNLPNYVKDGTSPYLHRCPRTIVQKENIDWLTKLRKENNKHARSVTPEEKKTSAKVVTPNSSDKMSLSGVKRRLAKVKCSPAEGKASDQTLHKFFKISNKPSEISFSLQEAQKKASAEC